MSVRILSMVVALIPLLAVTASSFCQDEVIDAASTHGRDWHPWNDFVGKKVIAEGIAWGSTDPGLGQYLVLNWQLLQDMVYIHGIDFIEEKAEGRLDAS